MFSFLFIKSLDEWVEEIMRCSPLTVKLYLVATKVDLVNNRVVSEESLHKKAEELGVGFIEVSSKTGHNIDNLFYRIVIDLQPLKLDISRIKRKGTSSAQVGEPLQVNDSVNDQNSRSMSSTCNNKREESVTNAMKNLVEECTRACVIS